MGTCRTSVQPAEHRYAEVLRTLYRDWEKLPDYAAEGFVLHRSDRSVKDVSVCRGVQDALTHRKALLYTTDNTLEMDVRHVIANDHFGVAMGVLTARRPREVEMPFCDLWRFVDGDVVEHWENVYFPSHLDALLAEPARVD